MYKKLALLFVSVTLAVSQTPPTITNSNNVDIEEYPFFVAVEYMGELFQGGTIVSDRHIITASGGFVLDVSEITVRVGSDIQGRGKIYNASAFYPFNDVSESYIDLAIIELETPLELSPTVQPLRIAPYGEIPFVGSIGYSLGWGEDVPGERLRLQKAFIIVIDKEICQNEYLETFQNIKNSTLCGNLDGVLCSPTGAGNPFIYDYKLAASFFYNQQVCPGSTYPDLFNSIGYEPVRQWIETITGL